MAAPLVSIVVPTRDRVRWLPRAIDSLLAQDYPRVEVLVVDDGSQDDTARLLADYARRIGTGFRAVRQEPAGGGAAINLGWALAAGDVVGYLSDDDALHPAAVSRLVAALESDPGAVVAYPAYQVVSDRGTVLDSVLPIEYSPDAAIRLHATVIGPGALIRRSALEPAGAWDTSLRWIPDLILWMTLGLRGRAIRVPEVLAYWTRHKASATLQLGAEHALEHIRAAQIGLTLPGMPAQPPGARAEALKNACVHGAIFGGAGDGWPMERFAVIDLHRPFVSGWAAHRNPHALPTAATSAETAALWRRLSDSFRASSAVRPSGGGYESAVARLQVAGAWPGGHQIEGDGRALRVALLEAAVACEADLDPGDTRFLIFDRARVPGLDLETSRVLKAALFGLAGSPDELRRLIQRAEGGRQPRR